MNYQSSGNQGESFTFTGLPQNVKNVNFSKIDTRYILKFNLNGKDYAIFANFNEDKIQ